MLEVYASLLLHSAGKPITAESVKKVLEAIGAKVDEGKIKALVASLEGVDVEKILQEAVVPTAPAAPPEKEEEEEKKEEEEREAAVSGLGALFE